MSRLLVLCAGTIFLFSALVYSEALFGILGVPQPDTRSTTSTVGAVRVVFLSVGMMLIAASYLMRRVAWLDRLSRKRSITNGLLSVLPLLTLLFIGEIALGPFVELNSPETTLFERDDALDWKLKPNTEADWGGVRVKINGKGLRGPELDYARTPGVSRILFLGDSVTFGFGVAGYENSFPYLLESFLEERMGRGIETVNAGVGGYSPWQEHIYFTTEGVKYQPDLVVLSFVLNDVTEKFELMRFGGTAEGHQLGLTVDTLARVSNLLYFARKARARLRFGRNVQQGAVLQEAIHVMALARHPERDSIKTAWDITLVNMSKIYAFSQERKIPIVLVVFPAKFQFQDVPALSTPQAIVTEHATGHGVPVIDLLPILNRFLLERGDEPSDIFRDRMHLSVQGSEVVAEILADHIERENLL